MKKSKQKVIGIVLGVLGLLFGIGATLFKIVANVTGMDPTGPHGWALRLSTVQLTLAACLIATGCFLIYISRKGTHDQGFN